MTNSSMLYICGDLQLYNIWTFQDDFYHQIFSVFPFGLTLQELFLFLPNRPVLIGHRGVVQVKILAHLRDELHLLVDAVEAKTAMVNTHTESEVRPRNAHCSLLDRSNAPIGYIASQDLTVNTLQNKLDNLIEHIYKSLSKFGLTVFGERNYRDY